jgi:hypothetical protein
MKKVLIFVLLAAVWGCGGKDSPTAPSTPPAPTNITINGPDTVTLGATATYTASSSTCSWNTTEGYIATVAAGVVSGNQSGQTTLYCEQQGVRGSKTIRVLPNYQGNWIGSYAVTGCSQTGSFSSINFCSNYPTDRVFPTSARLTQSGTSVSGTFDLGQITGQQTSASINTDGSVSLLINHNASGGFTITSSWNINMSKSGQISGSNSSHWIYAGLGGEGRIDGRVFNVNKGSGLTTSSAAPRVFHTLQEAFDALSQP